MVDSILQAIPRKEKPKKLRRNGFIPAVIYGEKYSDGLPVQFELIKFMRIINKHGRNAKLKISVDNEMKIGIIKEIQIDPVTDKILHLDIQLIEQDEDIKLKVPIVFTGVEILEANKLLLQIIEPEVNVYGKAGIIPDSIKIDVSSMKHGDKITVASLKLPEGVTVHTNSDMFAVVIVPKEEKAAAGNENSTDSSASTAAASTTVEK